MFYDMHVQMTELEKAAEMSKRLGFSGIGVTIPWRSRASLHEIQTSAKKLNSDVTVGIEIKARPHDIGQLAKSIRRQTELILVRGGSEEINRAALETPEVDILVAPILENGQPGINHILARLGARNNVAICFDFREVMQAYKKTRSNMLTSMMETARFVRKYRCPFVLSSGALGEWDMRGPSELMAFGKFLGFDERQCKGALSGEILKENRRRLAGKWIMPGVEVE